jgi:uncharacterized lipoprotein YmbA
MRFETTSSGHASRPPVKWLAPLLALAFVGCASTPATRLHTLMPAQSTARPVVAAGSGAAPLPIVLEPIRVPAQVDQPQWLVRLPDDSLALLEQERWAAPLQDELRQALLEELGGPLRHRRSGSRRGVALASAARGEAVRIGAGSRGAHRGLVAAERQ